MTKGSNRHQHLADATSLVDGNSTDADPAGAGSTEHADLTRLLRDLSPRLNDGRYVYTQVPGSVPAGADPIVTVREDEGLTLILSQQRADELGLPYTYIAAWITLQVRSDLAAVGLTAAVSRALAAADISANVVAGFNHDHVFVPYGLAGDAMSALAALAGP